MFVWGKNCITQIPLLKITVWFPSRIKKVIITLVIHVGWDSEARSQHQLSIQLVRMHVLFQIGLAQPDVPFDRKKCYEEINLKFHIYFDDFTSCPSRL